MTTKVFEKISSRAPTRIDLAGGTLDIWPLYVFLKNPLTVNVAIDLFAEAELEEFKSGKTAKVVLESQDQGVRLDFPWSQLENIVAPPALELQLRLLRYFAAEKQEAGKLNTKNSFKISTIARSPAGAGLGGSSALAVAIIGAMATWARGKFNKNKEGERLIQITRDIETTVIQVPAGIQDYYGAMFGGLQSLSWRAEAHKREQLPKEILQNLEKRLVLFYSGQSRNSGINNWALFKSFIDTPDDTRGRFQAISHASQDLDVALRKGDWDGATSAIQKEWEVRKTLAAGITTDQIDQAFAIAKRLGVSAGKVCGAGGGGCFFLMTKTDNQDLRANLCEKIGAIAGLKVLPFRLVPNGLEIKVSSGESRS